MEFWGTILVSASIAAIASIGLFLQIRSGQLNAGMAVFVGVGAYSSGALSLNAGLPPWLGICCAVLLGAVFGAVFSAITLRLHHWFFAIATLTLSVAAVSAVGRLDFIGGPLGLVGIPLVNSPWPPVLALVVCFVTALLFDRSRFGLAVRAVGDDEALAGMFGVRVRRLRVGVFALGAGMAALSGALSAHRFGVYQPSDLGVQASLLLFVYVIIGGRDNVAGPVLGTFFLFIFPDLVPMPPEAQQLIFGAMMTLVAVVFPGGLARVVEWFGGLTRRPKLEG
ncbi:MAG: branched-chain amino acid ABC transporter permease [Janthinobacterium lividum]